MSVLRKRDAASPVPSPGGSAAVDRFFLSYPSIWEMLTLGAYPDGSARETSTVTFFVSDGQTRVCLNDRDNGLTGWASGEGVFEALEALEGMLAADSVQWRVSPGGKGAKRKRS